MTLMQADRPAGLPPRNLRNRSNLDRQISVYGFPTLCLDMVSDFSAEQANGLLSCVRPTGSSDGETSGTKEFRRNTAWLELEAFSEAYARWISW